MDFELIRSACAVVHREFLNFCTNIEKFMKYARIIKNRSIIHNNRNFIEIVLLNRNRQLVSCILNNAAI